MFCSTNNGFKKVPFIWAGAERAFQIKHNRELRDVNGWLIYPIMSMERTGITKDLAKRGAYYAAAMNAPDNKGGSMTVARTIKQDKTANFANADAFRRVSKIAGTEQRTFPKKNEKIVYQYMSIPIPVYLDITYICLIFIYFKC